MLEIGIYVFLFLVHPLTTSERSTLLSGKFMILHVHSKHHKNLFAACQRYGKEKPKKLEISMFWYCAQRPLINSYLSSLKKEHVIGSPFDKH
jgi:hypothetical protein